MEKQRDTAVTADLRYYAETLAAFSDKFGAESWQVMVVSPESERGHDFLLAFNEATENKYLAEFEGSLDDDDKPVDIIEISELHIKPGAEFEMLVRQARLALLTLIDGPPPNEDEC